MAESQVYRLPCVALLHSGTQQFQDESDVPSHESTLSFPSHRSPDAQSESLSQSPARKSAIKKINEHTNLVVIEGLVIPMD